MFRFAADKLTNLEKKAEDEISPPDHFDVDEMPVSSAHLTCIVFMQTEFQLLAHNLKFAIGLCGALLMAAGFNEEVGFSPSSWCQKS